MHADRLVTMPDPNSGTTVIDQATGASLLGLGRQMRLCVLGRHYGADEILPDAACAGLNRSASARRFVRTHMMRYYGADPSHWPLSARYFVQD